MAVSEWKAGIPAWLWAVAMLILVEVFLRIGLDWPNQDAVSPSLRNDFPYRGWPEYTAFRERHKDVVLIGNSQGVGAEFPDVKGIYAFKLYQSLQASDREIRLHNWSQLGALSHQLAILTDRALSPPPAMVMVVVSLTNFNPRSADLLGRDATDIPLMLSPQALLVGGGIPSLQESRLDTRLSIAYQRLSEIGRTRTAFQDILAEGLPVRHHRFVFGGRHLRTARKPLSERPARSGQRIQRPLQVPMNAERWEAQFRENQLPVALGFYHWLRARLTDLDTRLLWVWMPHGNHANEGAALTAMAPIKREFCEQVIADGHRCEDLDGRLSGEAFISQDLASHLSQIGHEQMAQLLHPLIINGLH